MENADAANTGHLARGTPDDLSDVARTDLDSKVLTQIVEGPAGLALAGTLDGRLVAVTAGGEIAWETEVPGPVRTAPAWTGEHIVVMPRAEEAVALTPSGETAWTLPVENVRSSASVVRMASPAVTASGDVILADMQGTVYRVTPEGDLTWTHDAGGERAVEATPAITPQGHVVVASFVPGTEDAGRLEVLDGETGEPVWRKGIGSQVVGAPTLVDDVILVPLRDGDAVQARSLEDGSLEWEVAYDDHVTGSPTVYEGIAIAGDIRGVLRGIDVASGEVEWSFNPLSDDPSVDTLPGGSCTVLTVADSVAVDRDGAAWVPYWNADICNGFPPSDSGRSPFYLLSATSGDRLDRTRYEKAAHGPAIHATGVWAGSDMGEALRWDTGPHLAIDAFATGTNVTLVTNTDRAGTWQIDTGTGEAATGAGTPPVVSHHTLDPGRHTITVTVGDAIAQTTVDVQADDDGSTGGDGGGAPDDGTDDADGSNTSDGTGADGQDDATAPSEDDEAQTDGTPVPLVAPMLALALAAWGRRRG